QLAMLWVAEPGDGVLGGAFAQGALRRILVAEDPKDQGDREGFRGAGQAECENPGVVAAGDRGQRLRVIHPRSVELRAKMLEQRPGRRGHLRVSLGRHLSVDPYIVEPLPGAFSATRRTAPPDAHPPKRLDSAFTRFDEVHLLPRLLYPLQGLPCRRPRPRAPAPAPSPHT